MKPQRILASGALVAASSSAFAAGGDLGQAVKQATNWTAICMFIALHHQVGS
jgi:cation/acetate symporter